MNVQGEIKRVCKNVQGAPHAHENIITDGAHESTICTSESRQGKMANTYNQKVTCKGNGKRPAEQHDLCVGSRKLIPGPSASRAGSSESTAIPISSNVDTNCSTPAKCRMHISNTRFQSKGKP